MKEREALQEVDREEIWVCTIDLLFNTEGPDSESLSSSPKATQPALERVRHEPKSSESTLSSAAHEEAGKNSFQARTSQPQATLGDISLYLMRL